MALVYTLVFCSLCAPSGTYQAQAPRQRDMHIPVLVSYNVFACANPINHLVAGCLLYVCMCDCLWRGLSDANVRRETLCAL